MAENPNQSERQQDVRDATGTSYSLNGDWHALFDDEGIPVGTFNERMIAWINGQLSTSYGNLNQAKQAYATAYGFYNWDSMDEVTVGDIVAGDGDPVSYFYWLYREDGG